MRWRRRRTDDDFGAEIRAHIAIETERLVDEGMTRTDAEHSARQLFGNQAAAQERFHWSSRIRWIHDLGHDARLGLRALRRAPAFAVAAIATLALGIGASTATFTVVDAVLWRPLRFAEPNRLVMVRAAAATCCARVSEEYLAEWRLESRLFEDMAGWHDARVTLTGGGEPLEVSADRTTANFFHVLGTPATLGSTFTGVDLQNVEHEVVLAHGFWQRRFGGDPGVLGQQIALDGEGFTIVGVMPEDFAIRTLELPASRAELWIPFSLVRGAPGDMGGPLHVVARLKPGVTIDRGRSELEAISVRIGDTQPASARRVAWRPDVVALHEATVRDVRLALLVLFGAAGILLLIACANVANLTLGRTATRQAEVAIRLSIGATRGRLIRQFLTESLVLAGCGGVLGVVIAVWGTRLLVSAIPVGVGLPRTGEIVLDGRVLAVAMVVMLFTGVVFGLAPAFSATRGPRPRPLSDALRASSPGGTRHRPAGALVITEVALALMLLASAGLLGRTFWALTRVDPGFRSEQVLTMRTALSPAGYQTGERIRAFMSDLLDRVRRLPGVQAVGVADYLPLTQFGVGASFEIDGKPAARPADQPGAWMNVVGGDYFAAMGIPLLQGRLFDARDTPDAPSSFVINDALAQRFWPGEDPIGARLTWRLGPGESTSGQVVGVVGSVRFGALAADPEATVYFWFPQDPDREFTLVARTSGDATSIGTLLTTQIRDIDPHQPAGEIRPMQDIVSAAVAQPRFTMLLLGSFAGAALLLAAIGLYGVVSLGVTQRTREIGVRVALGAQAYDVLRLFMVRGLRLTATGLVIGLGAALAAGRLVAGLLYGVTPTDPVTLAAVAALVTATAALATYLPVRKAMQVNPMVALRRD